ncbi:hypothetical protein ACJX0J_005742, partial [Zea mays]
RNWMTCKSKLHIQMMTIFYLKNHAFEGVYIYYTTQIWPKNKMIYIWAIFIGSGWFNIWATNINLIWTVYERALLRVEEKYHLNSNHV